MKMNNSELLTPYANKDQSLRPKVIIAGKDPVSRDQMAKSLAQKTHAVETTGSAAFLMQNLLQGGLSVVVLGDELEEGLPVADLVPLLKNCNPSSTIILVGDDVPKNEEFKARQQGIFYYTNRPVCNLGWDELHLAVDCACNKVMHTTSSRYSH